MRAQISQPAHLSRRLRVRDFVVLARTSTIGGITSDLVLEQWQSYCGQPDTLTQTHSSILGVSTLSYSAHNRSSSLIQKVTDQKNDCPAIIVAFGKASERPGEPHIDSRCQMGVT